MPVCSVVEDSIFSSSGRLSSASSVSLKSSSEPWLAVLKPGVSGCGASSPPGIGSVER